MEFFKEIIELLLLPMEFIVEKMEWYIFCGVFRSSVFLSGKNGAKKQSCFLFLIKLQFSPKLNEIWSIFCLKTLFFP